MQNNDITHLYKKVLGGWQNPWIFVVYTVKPVYNNQPWDPKFVAVVDRWLLIRGRSLLQKLKLGLKDSGHCRQVVAIRR